MRAIRLLLLIWVCLLTGVGAADAMFMRSDANQDGGLDVADAVTMLKYLFHGEPITCHDALDTDDNGAVNLADPVLLIAYLFQGSKTPAEPFTQCGQDVTEDPLTCASFSELVCPTGPPICLSEEDLSAELSVAIDQPVCLPSPLFEWEILGSTIVACPEGSTCSNENPGCELIFQDIAVEVDLAAGTIGAVITVTAVLPVEVVTTDCSADMTLQIALLADVTLAETEWDDVRQIEDVGNVRIELSELTLDSSGGFVCGLLDLSGALLQELLQGQIDEWTAGLFDQLNLDLGGIYVCP